MKDTLLTYKLYLQTLINIRDGNEVKGDRETLKILEKDLEGINESNRENDWIKVIRRNNK